MHFNIFVELEMCGPKLNENGFCLIHTDPIDAESAPAAVKALRERHSHIYRDEDRFMVVGDETCLIVSGTGKVAEGQPMVTVETEESW